MFVRWFVDSLIRSFGRWSRLFATFGACCRLASAVGVRDRSACARAQMTLVQAQELARLGGRLRTRADDACRAPCGLRDSRYLGA